MFRFYLWTNTISATVVQRWWGFSSLFPCLIFFVVILMLRVCALYGGSRAVLFSLLAMITACTVASVIVLLLSKKSGTLTLLFLCPVSSHSLLLLGSGIPYRETSLCIPHGYPPWFGVVLAPNAIADLVLFILALVACLRDIKHIRMMRRLNTQSLFAVMLRGSILYYFLYEVTMPFFFHPC